MGVGVQKAIDHHHAKVEPRQVLHHLVELHGARRQLVVQLINLGSRAALHDQDPAARVFLEHIGGSNGEDVRPPTRSRGEDTQADAPGLQVEKPLLALDVLGVDTYSQLFTFRPSEQIHHGSNRGLRLPEQILRGSHGLADGRLHDLALQIPNHALDEPQPIEILIVVDSDALQQHRGPKEIHQLLREHEGPGVKRGR